MLGTVIYWGLIFWWIDRCFFFKASLGVWLGPIPYAHMSWQTTLEQHYEQIDPHYEHTEDAMNNVMKTYITGLIQADPTLMHNHEFVHQSYDWLDKRVAATLFAPYQSRLVSTESFARASVDADPGVIKRFDLSSTPYYDDICMVAVKQSWRVLDGVNMDRCEHAQEICTTALQNIHKVALQRQHDGRNNKYIIKYAINKVLPIATSAGLSDRVVHTWKTDLETVLSTKRK
jgi:hypothetical protein